MTTVVVFGAAGRMGSTSCAAVDAADDLELGAVVDPNSAGARLGDLASVHGEAADLRVLARAEEIEPGIDVAVDFTLRSAALANLDWCAANGVHAVCGTTGFDQEDLEHIRQQFEDPERPANAVVAPNFSIGAVLMMRCAELCAPNFESVEVIELHHERKRDAPSGTSLATVSRMEAARRTAGSSSLPPDPTEVETLPGARGSRSAEGVHVHSVRLPGLLAHQEVIFGSAGETLRLRHDSTDRASFMAGVLLAVRRVPSLPGLTVGLDSLLGI